MTTAQRTYPMAKILRQVCARLGLDEQPILSQAQLPRDFLVSGSGSVDAPTFMALWDAVARAADLVDLPYLMGIEAAKGQVSPALTAFSCSPDVQTGFNRLALFKPLVAPFQLQVTRESIGLRARVRLADPTLLLPEFFPVFEVVHFLECARSFTGVHIRPVFVQTIKSRYVTQQVRDYLDVPLHFGPHAEIVFSHADAARPLLSEDTEFWRLLEAELMGQLRALQAKDGVQGRVRRILVDTLPSGEASVEHIASRLAMSPRSLQRHLKAEGASFRGVLDETRASLAQTYLKRDDMSVEEISYLLAYRDPNAFYRAFRAWTGTTPGQMRRAG